MKRISMSVQEDIPEMRYWLIAILVLVLLLWPAIVESAEAEHRQGIDGRDRPPAGLAGNGCRPEAGATPLQPVPPAG